LVTATYATRWNNASLFLDNDNIVVLFNNIVNSRKSDMQLIVTIATLGGEITKMIWLCRLTVEGYDFEHVDNSHLHPRVNHNDAVFAD
jgi:hypothetical protein